MPTFTLASFNICSAHFREGHYTEDNLNRLAEKIAQSGADVVCLQEVDRGASRSDRVDMPSYLAERTELLHATTASLSDWCGALDALKDNASVCVVGYADALSACADEELTIVDI